MPAAWYHYYCWFADMFMLADELGHHGLADEIRDLARHEFPLL